MASAAMIAVAPPSINSIMALASIIMLASSTAQPLT